MKTLICSNCGGEFVRGSRISQHKGRTVPVVRCLQCNLEFDQYSGEYYREFIDIFTFDKDSPIFEIGLKGLFNSVEYEIVGRVRYQDESRYEKSTWDEWFVQTSNGKFGCILEENERIYFYHEYNSEPIHINKTEGGNPSIEFAGEAVKKISSYTGRAVLIEGDIPYILEIGDGVKFYDFKRDGENYTLKVCDKIVKVSRGERLALSEVIEWFNIEKFRADCSRMTKKWISFKYESRVYVSGMIIALILSAYNCFGDIPIKDIMSSKNVISENILAGNDEDQIYESQILYGSFDVPEKDKLYNVTIGIDNANLSETDIVTFRLMFIDENRLMEALSGKSDAASLKETFDRIDAFMYPIESYMIKGYIYAADDHRPVYGLGKESNFVVDESGKYYFYLEFFSNCIIDIDSIKISMSRTGSSIYYLIAAFIFFILFGLCNKHSRYYKEFTKSMLKQGL